MTYLLLLFDQFSQSRRMNTRQKWLWIYDHHWIAYHHPHTEMIWTFTIIFGTLQSNIFGDTFWIKCNCFAENGEWIKLINSRYHRQTFAHPFSPLICVWVDCLFKYIFDVCEPQIVFPTPLIFDNWLQKYVI